MKKTILVAWLFSGLAAAQTLPAGPKVTLTAVTQLAPTLPQYTRVDIPMLREQMAAASNGRVEVNLKSYPEMSVQGPEVIRLVRSGQVEIAARRSPPCPATCRCWTASTCRACTTAWKGCGRPGAR